MAKELTGDNALFDPVYWLKNVSISFLATIVLLFMGSIAATYFAMPDSIIHIMVTIITALCVMWGGYKFSSRHGRQGLICGSISGLLYIIVLYIAGTLIFKEFSFDMTVVISALMWVLCGAVGGLAGVNFKPKKRRRK